MTSLGELWRGSFDRTFRRAEARTAGAKHIEVRTAEATAYEVRTPKADCRTCCLPALSAVRLHHISWGTPAPSLWVGWRTQRCPREMNPLDRVFPEGTPAPLCGSGIWGTLPSSLWTGWWIQRCPREMNLLDRVFPEVHPPLAGTGFADWGLSHRKSSRRREERPPGGAPAPSNIILARK